MSRHSCGCPGFVGSSQVSLSSCWTDKHGQDFHNLLRTFERSICSDILLRKDGYVSVNAYSEECCVTESIYYTCHGCRTSRNVKRLSYPWLRELDFRLRINEALIDIAPPTSAPPGLRDMLARYASALDPASRNHHEATTVDLCAHSAPDAPADSRAPTSLDRVRRVRRFKAEALALFWQLRDVVAHVHPQHHRQAQRQWLSRLSASDCSIMIQLSEHFGTMLHAQLATDPDPLFRHDSETICVFESVALQRGPYFTCYALGRLPQCRRYPRARRVQLYDWAQALMREGAAACREWEADAPRAEPSMQSVIIQCFIEKAGLRRETDPARACPWWDAVRDMVEKRMALYKF